MSCTLGLFQGLAFQRQASSMVNMIKQISGADVVVGQNGRVWIKADNPETELVVARAIHLIDLASHIKGLTDKIRKFLEKEIKKLPSR